MIKYHSVMTDTWSIVCRRKYIIIYKTSSKYYIIIRIMNASVVFDEWNARFCIVSSWLCNTLVKSTHFRHVASGWGGGGQGGRGFPPTFSHSKDFSCIYIFKKVNYWGVPPSPNFLGTIQNIEVKIRKWTGKLKLYVYYAPPPPRGGGG